jgi:hypothetical protein
MSRISSIFCLIIISVFINAFSQGSPFEQSYPDAYRRYDPYGHITTIVARSATDADYLGTVEIIDDYNENGVYSGSWGTSSCYPVTCLIPSRLSGGQEILATLLIAKTYGKFVKIHFVFVGTDKVITDVEYK